MIYIRRIQSPLWGLVSDDFSPALVAESKATPGMRWEPLPVKAWVGYRDAVAITAERLRARGIRVSGEIPPVSQTTLLTPIANKKLLRSYQLTGVEFILRQASEGALLADDVGLGKTLQAITAARSLREEGRFTLVVCPSFVRSVWEDQVAEYWPEAKVAMLNGTKPDAKKAVRGEPLDSADVVVCHYDIVHAWTQTLIGRLNGVIVDEAHYLMSEKSRRSTAVKAIARRAAWRLALTATPITSRPKDLWNIVDTVSPGRFGGSAFNYLMRYCNGHREQVTPQKAVWKFDGASHLDELTARLNSGIMLRRLKSDVSLELPERQRQVVTFDVPKNYLITPAVAMGDDKMLRRSLDLAADGKLPAVAELAAEYAEAGHNLVLFCQRKVVAEQLVERLINLGVQATYSHGDLPVEERIRRIKSKPKVLAVTIDSVVVGIDLTFADVGFIVELDWTPSKLIQGEGRLHRFKQGRNVLFIYCVARGSVDEIIKRVCISKLDTFEAGIGKLDDGLKSDFLKSQAASGAAALRALYDAMLKEGGG